MPTGLSECWEGGALPTVCCYWAAGLDAGANQERGRLRRAEVGARVAIATGTPLGRARLCGGRGDSRGLRPTSGPGPGPREAKPRSDVKAGIK